MSRKHGVSEEQLLALDRHKESPLFSEAEKLALEYAEEMTRTPVNVPESLFDKLRQRFTQPQIVELTAVAAFENFRARFDHALEIESEGFCLLPLRGGPHRRLAPLPLDATNFRVRLHGKIHHKGNTGHRRK